MTALQKPATGNHRTENGLTFDCADPLMVRADLLVIGQSSRGSSPVGAVIDGVMIDMGAISTALLSDIEHRASPQAVVTAPHFAGGTVTRKIPVVYK